MVKRVQPSGAGRSELAAASMPPDPLFLTTAIEAVVRAGDLQMAHFGRDFRDRQEGHDRSRHRGRPRRRADVPRADRRALSRSPGSRRGDGRRARPCRPGPCWVFDPIDGTTNFAHGLPIFCASLALEIDGVAEVAAVYDPNRKELFTAERGGGAFLNGTPLRVSSAARAGRRDARDRISLRRARARRRDRRAVRARSSGRRARCGGSARRRSTSATSRPGGMDGFWETRSEAVGHRRRRADRRGSRRPRHRARTAAPFTLARRPRPGHQRPPARRHARRDRGRFATGVLRSGRSDIRERQPAAERSAISGRFSARISGIPPATDPCRRSAPMRRLIPAGLRACRCDHRVDASRGSWPPSLLARHRLSTAGLNFSIGGFVPRRRRTRRDDRRRAASTTWISSRSDIEDFNGATFGGEWLAGLGDNFEAGLGVGYYSAAPCRRSTRTS